MALKTAAEVREEFDRCGDSISSWAGRHGIPRNIVSGILLGRLKGKRGHAHNAAVLLGLKEGVVERREETLLVQDPGDACGVEEGVTET